MNSSPIGRPIRVHGTELLADDTRQEYREKLARITLDSMVQFVGLLDARGTVLEINKVALDAAGIELADVEGKPFWTTFWWGVSDEIQRVLCDGIARAGRGEFVRWDTPIYGRAGGKETIVIDASLCPVMDEHGEVVFIAAEGRDISQKKAYEEEIARKNLDLQALLERLRELDEIHELRTPAKEAERATATPRAKVLVVEDNPEMNRFVAQCLAHDYDVVSAFDGHEGLEQAVTVRPDLIISDIMMPRMSGEQMIGVLRQRSDMHEIPILLLSAKADEELKLRLLDDGAQDFITKPFTERELVVRARNLVMVKRSREALREVERAKRQAVEASNVELRERTLELSRLFQQAPSFMAVLRGPDHVFELANPACYQLLGHRDILGRSVAEALPEIPGQGFTALLDQVLATGEPHTDKGIAVLLQRNPSAPLEERYVDFVFQPLLAADGRVAGVFVEGSDVTDRKRAEEALRAADRRKDEFLATLAHELRNPLAPIRHAARISKMPRATEAQMKWSQDVIDRQVEHMARLLDDLLEVSRITRGKLDLRTERLVLKDSLIAAVETTRPLVETRGHRLMLDVPAETLHIDADPVRFAQIFSNLLTNAAKYTDPGGLIRVQAQAVGDHAVVTVTDNGIGIAPELLPQLFEMFSQATSALERSEGGLGIGLALVRGLVTLHGGSIEARSRGIGMGSEFVVTLPLDRYVPSRAASVEAATLAGHDAPSLRVLVADDNRDNADGCAMLLEMCGHSVRTAYSGREALAVAAEFLPQVALLDIGMPELNGYEVARRIRAAPWGQTMLLVAVTGWGQDEDQRQAEAAGFDHHRANRSICSRSSRYSRTTRAKMHRSGALEMISNQHGSGASMNEPSWLTIARELQALAQTGLTYATDRFDLQRYTRIRELAASLMALGSSVDTATILDLLRHDVGYATPKVDVRGAAFVDGRVLLVRELSDGRWALPGGWADVNQSAAECVVREIVEESGFQARAVKLAAIRDYRKAGHPPPHLYSLYKLFFLCEITGGEPRASDETSEVGFFERDALPPLSMRRTTAEQIHRMFEHHEHPDLATDFD